MPKNTLPLWLKPTVFAARHVARVVLYGDTVGAELAERLTRRKLPQDDLVTPVMTSAFRTTLGTLALVLNEDSAWFHCYAIANDPDASDTVVLLGVDEPRAAPFDALPLGVGRAIRAAGAKEHTAADVWRKFVELRNAESTSAKDRVWHDFIHTYPPPAHDEEPPILTSVRDLLVRESNLNYKSKWSFVINDVPNEPPPFTLNDIRGSMPHGVLIAYDSALGTPEDVAAAFLATTGKRLARDNTYFVLGVADTKDGDANRLLVCWEPHGAKTPYLHLRKAVEHHIPASLGQPRHDVSHPPALPLPTGNEQVTSGFAPWEPTGTQTPRAELRIRFPEELARNRDEVSRQTKKWLAEYGVEAVGWYSPWHCYEEDAWGVYLHAERLEQLCFTAWLDASRYENVPYELAASMVIRKVYDHEMFHARMEAAAAFIEMTTGAPKLLQYQTGVYRNHYGTSDCLEEALANYYAYRKLESYVPYLCKAYDRRAVYAVRNAIRDLMDLSALGYRDWRIGDHAGTWATLATQLCTGTPIGSPSGGVLPIDSLLNDALPVDFLPDDVPLYVYGKSATMSALMDQPACFGVPSRRELCRALKHQGYEVLPGRGKGSHELWAHPDQRAFPVPQTDPVSRTIFGAFLDQCGLTKAEYLRVVRPEL